MTDGSSRRIEEYAMNARDYYYRLISTIDSYSIEEYDY
jgi:hypothetical protein